MRYMGSKKRLAKHLVPILEEHLKDHKAYVEPFLGSAAIMSKINAPIKVGSDIDTELMDLWRYVVRGGELPHEMSEEFYKAIKSEPQFFSTWLVAFAGFGCSYGGKWFGGFAKGSGRNYCDEAARSLEAMVPSMQDVILLNAGFGELKMENSSLIYCDPPYKGVTGYKGKRFNHDIFWQWAEEKTMDGHTVLVSEYSAPSDWEPIWEMPVVTTMDKQANNNERVEKLFILA